MYTIIISNVLNGYYMTQNENSKKTSPPPVQQAILTLGGQITLARKRRRLTMSEMASRMFVTRKTLSRLEKGEGGVTMTVLGAALWVLGMDRQLLNIADPAQDAAGIFMETRRMSKRIRHRKSDDGLDF